MQFQVRTVGGQRVPATLGLELAKQALADEFDLQKACRDYLAKVRPKAEGWQVDDEAPSTSGRVCWPPNVLSVPLAACGR
jgi:hypothetical protein